MMTHIFDRRPDGNPDHPFSILTRKVFTLLAAICDNPHNGVDVKPLAQRFTPILFEITGRHKLYLEKVCVCICDFSLLSFVCSCFTWAVCGS